MKIQILDNKSTILNFLKKNPELHIYSIGDLDDFFWPHTKWYGLIENNEIQSIALLYSGMETPTLLLFFKGDPYYSRLLLEELKPDLPIKFFTHLSPGLIDLFDNRIAENYGLHNKMALKKPSPEINDPGIRRLTTDDLQAIRKFYEVSYPANWFDKRMLETGKYFGYFVNKILAGISGIHVYSAHYKVAALGNIATHPEYRGRGIAFKLTSVLCNDLLKSADIIGLNVKADNDFAIRCYRKVGFEVIGEYDECLIDPPTPHLGG